MQLFVGADQSQQTFDQCRMAKQMTTIIQKLLPEKSVKASRQTGKVLADGVPVAKAIAESRQKQSFVWDHTALANLELDKAVCLEEFKVTARSSFAAPNWCP